jgi:hypothetical protein
LLGRDAALAQLLFGNKLMQWIGRRSYAIYLVHWPIIVLFKFTTDFQLDNAGRALLFVLTMIATVLLHELVEKPFRKRGEDTTTVQRIALPAILSVLLVTVSIAAAIWHLDGLAARAELRIQKIVDSVGQEKEKRQRAIRFGRCNLHTRHTFADYDVEECATVHADRKNVLVIGDSMAADTYMMLSQTYPEVRFLQATAGACTAILNISDVGGKYSTCETLNSYRFSQIVDLDLNLIVLASIWSENRIQPLKETVDYLHSRGKRVLVIGPRAIFRASIPLLVSRQNTFEGVNTRLRDQVLLNNDLLEQMRISISNVEILDIGKIQCTPHCDVIEGDRLLYYDWMHFTELGARRTGERLKESFDFMGYINSPVPPVDTR